ncbi:MAG: N-acyl homoserine lactonase family protein [Propionicimonas sp.]|nr:N-acyl homoserine lactonase family protein [Propionicimonas sp.]
MSPSGDTGPIRRLSVLSTGSVRIRPEHGHRTWRPLPVWLLTSRRWTPPLPINVFVIEHDRGLVLFDTGQDRRSVTDADYYPGGLAGVVYHRLAEFAIGKDETLPARLRSYGYQPDEVSHVVVSHLHQDHMGSVLDVPNAELLVSRTEWELVRRVGAEANGYLRRHIEAAAERWRPFDFQPAGADVAPFGQAMDLFGDGSLVLLPTPGHTPGSISLLVRRPGADPILLVGDLTFDAPHFGPDHLPGIGSLRDLRASTGLVEALRARLPGLAICAAHDPAAAGSFRAAVDAAG